MEEIVRIPGYITLKDAEEKYGVKADTLKKRCQRGDIVGAKKVGKTWFVPTLPGIDPNKTIPENYPGLDFDAAYISNLSLFDAESEARSALYDAHRNTVYIWEYGYYFFSLIISHTTVHRSYLPIAALLTEAQSALRCSFLLNLNGYHPDAYALLRRSHECVIKAIAGRIKPQNVWEIGFATGNQRAEHLIGVDFKSLWKVESSFNHSNLMKLFETGKDLQDPVKVVGVTYGPQINHKQFAAAMNTSIFWLYVLIKSLPYLFPNQISQHWLSKQEQSSKLMKDHLIAVKALQEEVNSIDNAIANLMRKEGIQNEKR